MNGYIDEKPAYVIVAGGRDYSNHHQLYEVMDRVRREAREYGYIDIVVVCGMARGADMWGYNWAKERGVEIAMFRANWDKYGKSAGYKRNELMADYADALVAFYDGTSKGTGHMIDIAKREGLSIEIINYGDAS